MACVASRTGRELQRYTNNGGRQVVGCIPYRYIKGPGDEQIEVLLISSQKGSPNPKMMFPKGGWELDETLEQAAVRESLEEAGVVGQIKSQLGEWNFLSKRFGSVYVGYMFPLLVEKELDYWPEKDLRQRTWMSVQEAKEVCQHNWMKIALDKLVDRLASTSSHLQLQHQ